MLYVVVQTKEFPSWVSFNSWKEGEANLYGTEMVHEKIRQLFAQFIHLNRETFRPYIEGDIDTHIARMRHNRVWGTATELLAAASLLQLPVFTFIPHGTIGSHTNLFVLIN